MVDRYISEKALIENIVKIQDLRTLSTKTIGEAISNTPTADVVEVKYGKWLWNRGCAMADRFPKDCWDKKCPHFKTWDMSIDDLCCYCDLLKIRCDACDEDFCLYLCPLPNDTRTPKETHEKHTETHDNTPKEREDNNGGS